jgi:hypothetical protein
VRPEGSLPQTALSGGFLFLECRQLYNRGQLSIMAIEKALWVAKCKATPERGGYGEALRF